MLGRLFHRVQILAADATAAVVEIVEQGFPGRRSIHPDGTAHHFREGLASTLGVAELLVGIEFQGDCLCRHARKIHETRHFGNRRRRVLSGDGQAGERMEVALRARFRLLHLAGGSWRAIGGVSRLESRFRAVVPAVSALAPRVSRLVPAVSDFVAGVSCFVPAVRSLVPDVSGFVPTVRCLVFVVSAFVSGVSQLVPAVKRLGSPVKRLSINAIRGPPRSASVVRRIKERRFSSAWAVSNRPSLIAERRTARD